MSGASLSSLEKSEHSTAEGGEQVRSSWCSKDKKLGVKSPPKHRILRTVANTMVDSGPVIKPGTAAFVLPDNDDGGDGGYVTGGWKSVDGRLNCGYSSFMGKRATMEDFFDVKSSEIDGQTISFFGIFDAIALSDDHKPNRIDERRRIENAGGIVMWADDRVNKDKKPLEF